MKLYHTSDWKTDIDILKRGDGIILSNPVYYSPIEVVACYRSIYEGGCDCECDIKRGCTCGCRMCEAKPHTILRTEFKVYDGFLNKGILEKIRQWNDILFINTTIVDTNGEENEVAIYQPRDAKEFVYLSGREMLADLYRDWSLERGVVDFNDVEAGVK